MNGMSLKKIMMSCLVGASMTVSAQEAPKVAPKVVDTTPAPSLEEAIKTVSSFYGYNIGSQLSTQKKFVSMDEFLTAIKAAVEGGKNPVDQATFQKAFKVIQDEQKRENLGDLKDFLTEKLTETPSGLGYKVVKEGSGDKPKAEDTVTVHYTGYLTDGVKFDSSVDRGQPATFALNQVIPGWTEGVQLMSIGSKYRFKIPGKLAYGERGAPPRIPANATLVFDIELIAIKKK
jgi:FKBP-type peptidyl-prolyl cis-trans isomerase FkpA